jgi:hypothetical protein
MPKWCLGLSQQAPASDQASDAGLWKRQGFHALQPTEGDPSNTGPCKVSRISCLTTDRRRPQRYRTMENFKDFMLYSRQKETPAIQVYRTRRGFYALQPTEGTPAMKEYGERRGFSRRRDPERHAIYIYIYMHMCIYVYINRYVYIYIWRVLLCSRLQAVACKPLPKWCPTSKLCPEQPPIWCPNKPKWWPKRAQLMPEACPSNSRNIPKWCPKYPQMMDETCPNDSRNIPTLCVIHAEMLPDIPDVWLATPS